MEWTRRPAYAVVPQSGCAKTNDRVVHWVDLHMGPITSQIRDLAGLPAPPSCSTAPTPPRWRCFWTGRLRRRRSHRRRPPVARV